MATTWVAWQPAPTGAYRSTSPPRDAMRRGVWQDSQVGALSTGRFGSYTPGGELATAPKGGNLPYGLAHYARTRGGRPLGGGVRAWVGGIQPGCAMPTILGGRPRSSWPIPKPSASATRRISQPSTAPRHRSQIGRQPAFPTERHSSPATTPGVTSLHRIGARRCWSALNAARLPPCICQIHPGRSGPCLRHVGQERPGLLPTTEAEDAHVAVARTRGEWTGVRFHASRAG